MARPAESKDDIRRRQKEEQVKRARDKEERQARRMRLSEIPLDKIYVAITYEIQGKYQVYRFEGRVALQELKQRLNREK